MKKQMKEDVGGELTDLPNEKYKKFFDRFIEIETLNIAEWKTIHILAYFVKKYKEQYNSPYKFKFNSPSPSKSFEVFQVKKMAMMLSSNPILLKEYIDWVFLNKVVKAKRKLTSISFLTIEDTLREYKINVLFSNNQNRSIDRSTRLPQKYIDILNDYALEINTYGDLAFLSQMNPLTNNIVNAFNMLKTDGFDMEILNKIL